MTVGFNAGAIGVVNQTGATANVTSTGTNLVSLGTNAGATGTYTIDASAGSSALNALGLRVGESGTGTFTQNGGTVTLSQGAIVGRNAGSTGLLNLNAGSLIAGTGGNQTSFTVGNNGTGTFNQTGGTATFNGASGHLRPRRRPAGPAPTISPAARSPRRCLLWAPPAPAASSRRAAARTRHSSPWARSPAPMAPTRALGLGRGGADGREL